MPGLVGLVSCRPKEWCEEKLKLMIKTTRHEAFYNDGVYLDDDMFTHIGWTCHDRSFTDCMPIFNESRNIILCLAGEVFSDLDQILDLQRKGHEFTEGDASYLVHLYEELGDKFFEELNGCFSGFLIDRRKGKSFLFNDRFGMHRIFIHHEKDSFFFSSEAKALLAVLPETREFDPKGLCELLTCGCTLGEHSLFKGIEILPGGSLLEFQNGNLIKISKYFDLTTWEEQDILPEAEFSLRLTEALRSATRRCGLSQLPIGISLTGGFDSRMVMACLDPDPGTIPCYTFGSMYRDNYDVKVSRQVAIACGQSHQTLVVGDEFLNKFPHYMEKAVYLSDGYLGMSGAAELYVNSLARDIAPVRLTGNWGSELLRRVRAFKFTEPRSGFLHPDLQPYIHEARESFMKLSLMNRLSFVAFQQAPHQSYGRISIERSQIIPRTPFLDNDVIRHRYKAADHYDGFALSELIIGRYRPDLLAIPTDRGFLGCDGRLFKIFRHTYRDALFKAEYVVGHGAPNWLVRQSHLLRFLQVEKNLLGRHKFNHFRQWLRDDLAEYVQDTLLAYRSFGIQTYFDPKRVEQTVNDHLNGKRNCTNEIDMMLTVALIFNFLSMLSTEKERI